MRAILSCRDARRAEASAVGGAAALAALDGEGQSVQVRARRGSRADRRRGEPAPLRRDDPRAPLRSSRRAARAVRLRLRCLRTPGTGRALLRLVQAGPCADVVAVAARRSGRVRGGVARAAAHVRGPVRIVRRERLRSGVSDRASRGAPGARNTDRQAAGANDLLRRRQPSPRAAPGRRARVRCSRRVPREAIPFARAHGLDWLPLRETGAGWSEYRPFIELGYPSARLEMSDGRVRIDTGDSATQAEVNALVERDLPYLAGQPE